MTLSIHEVISWVITIVTLTLFIYDKIRNPAIQYYMAFQGILMACHKKAVFYNSKASNINVNNAVQNISTQQYKDILECTSNDFYTLTQHIMGSMKAIKYDKDLPFDVISFVNAATKTKNNQNDNK